MALIKDGNVYRTEYEQIVHLTKKHEEQNTINENLSREVIELGVAANLGGYNLVRFAFETQGLYNRLAFSQIANPIDGSEVGDYFEFSSGNDNDIPAYGYLNADNYIEIAPRGRGDFSSKYETLTLRNVPKNKTAEIVVTYQEFE